MKKYFVPPKIYRKIISLVPICCIDLVIKKNNSFLLVKRKENPVKDKWWFAGGRVLFNERLVQTAKRKLKEELNIKSFRKIEFLKAEEMRFKKGRFQRPEHNIINVFLVELNEKDCAEIQADQTMQGFEWFGKIEKNFHPYVKRNLKLAGFK